MKIIEGQTRFGRKILLLGNREKGIQYRETRNRLCTITSRKKVNLYYKGAYSVNGDTLVLDSDKDASDAIKFLLTEKKLYRTKEFEIESIRLYNSREQLSKEISIIH